MKIVIGILLAASLVLGGGFWLYLAQQRRADDARELAEFDRALGRLEAGVEHESKLLLGKTIADTASAVDEYTKKSAARYVEPRAAAARSALRGLEQVMEGWGDYRVWQDERLFSALDGLGANEVERKCAKGRLYIEGLELNYAYMRAFRRDLAVARGKDPLLPAEKFDLVTATKACGEAFTKEKAARAAARAEKEKKRAAERAGAQAEWEKKAGAHLARFALHVELAPAEYTAIEISADGGASYMIVIGEGERKHLDAHSEMRISTREPDKLQISVNGRNWLATWARAGGGGRLSTIIRVQDLAARR